MPIKGFMEKSGNWSFRVNLGECVVLKASGFDFKKADTNSMTRTEQVSYMSELALLLILPSAFAIFFRRKCVASVTPSAKLACRQGTGPSNAQNLRSLLHPGQMYVVG